jgi:endonuclease YncB( thermonuclease family)
MVGVGAGLYALASRSIVPALERRGAQWLASQLGERAESRALPWLIEEAEAMEHFSYRLTNTHLHDKFFKENFERFYGAGAKEVWSTFQKELTQARGVTELADSLYTPHGRARIQKLGGAFDADRVREVFEQARRAARMQLKDKLPLEAVEKTQKVLSENWQLYADKGWNSLTFQASRGPMGWLHRQAGLTSLSALELERHAQTGQLAKLVRHHGLNAEEIESLTNRALAAFEQIRYFTGKDADKILAKLPSGYMRSGSDTVNTRLIERFLQEKLEKPLSSLRVPLVPFLMEMPPFRLFPFLRSEGFRSAIINPWAKSPEIARALGKDPERALGEMVALYGRRAYVFEGAEEGELAISRIKTIADKSGKAIDWSLRYARSGYYEGLSRVRGVEGGLLSAKGYLQEGIKGFDFSHPISSLKRLLAVGDQSEPSKQQQMSAWWQQFKRVNLPALAKDPEALQETLNHLHPRQLLNVLEKEEQLPPEIREQTVSGALSLLLNYSGREKLSSVKAFPELLAQLKEGSLSRSDAYLRYLQGKGVDDYFTDSYQSAFTRLFEAPGEDSVRGFIKSIESIRSYSGANGKFIAESAGFESAINRLLSEPALLHAPSEEAAGTLGKELLEKAIGRSRLHFGVEDAYSGLIDEWFIRRRNQLFSQYRLSDILSNEQASLLASGMPKGATLPEGMKGLGLLGLTQDAFLSDMAQASERGGSQYFEDAQKVARAALPLFGWQKALSENPQALETLFKGVPDEIKRKALGSEITRLSGLAELTGFENPLVSGGRLSGLRKEIAQPLQKFIDGRFGLTGRWLPPREAEDLSFTPFYPIVESYGIGNLIGDAFTNPSQIKGSLKQYAQSFRSAFDASAPLSEAGASVFFFSDRLNKYLAEIGLGLPDQMRQTPLRSMGAFLGLRVVPAMASIEAWKYLNHETRQLTGTSPVDLGANALANLQLTGARVRDSLGLTNLFKKMNDLSAGMDRYYTPRSEAETREFLTSGVSPVRRGRYWLIGTRSEFTGGGIEWFSPSWYQLAKSHWQESENVDLDSNDYWKHAWFPTLENPLAPLSRILDRDWWVNKHLKKGDRPYPFTSPAFDPESAWGSLLNPFANRFLGYGQPTTNLRAYQLREVNRQERPQNVTYTLTGVPEGSDLTTTPVSLLKTTKGGATRTFGFPSEWHKRLSGLGSLLGFGRDSINLSGPSGGMPSHISGRGFGAALHDLYGRGGILAEEPIRIEQGIRGRHPLKIAGEETLKEDFQDLLRSARGAMGVYGFFLEHVIETDRGDPFRVQSATHATGWSRRYWMREYGGLGGGLTEFYRRFFHAPEADYDAWNPLPNDQPSWIPEQFRQGDPYTRLRGIGELRLPGEAYERTHAVKTMVMRGSSIGKSIPEMISEFFHDEEPMSRYGEAVTAEGTRLHKVIQRRLHKQGLAIGTEVPIWDEKHQISGHIDAILRTRNGPEIIDIKTMSDKKFHSGEIFQEHIDQVTAYAKITGIHNLGLFYVNRDNPKEVTYHPVPYSEMRAQELLFKVDAARAQAREMVRRGIRRQGDLYDLVSRFEILSDIAPSSPQMRALSAQLADQADQLSEGEKARIKAARERSRQLRKSLDLHPYRFASQEPLINTKARVERIIGLDTVLLEGIGPVRLAGIHIPVSSLDKLGIEPKKGQSEAEAFWARYGVRKGSVIPVSYSGESRKSQASFIGETIPKAILGHNLNQQLLQSGLAEVNADDKSPAAVKARYNPLERSYGAAFEKFAHLDTIFHTKFLRVRSPLEAHLRGEIYGSEGTSWSNMMGDYIKPTIEAIASRNVIPAALTGAFIGSMFQETREGKLLFAKIGAGAGAALSLARTAFKGNNWIPGRVQKRWDLDTYYDALTYVKNRQIAAAASEQARRKEHVDPEALMAKHFAIGQWRLQREAKLNDVIRAYAETKGTSRFDLSLKEYREIRKVYEERRKLQNPSYEVLGPWATIAVQAQQAYQRTLFGLSSRSDMSQVLGALPRRHREIAEQIIETGSAREKEKFYHLLPELEKSALGRFLGVNKNQIPEKPMLSEYFKHHFLPGQDWEGWRPDVDLNQLKARSEEEERIEINPPSRARLMKAEAMTHGIAIPRSTHPSAHDLPSRLHNLLEGAGLEGMRVQVYSVPAERASLSLNLDLEYDDHDAVMEHLMKSL